MYVLWAFSIAVAFVPNIAGAATSPRWALVALSSYWLPMWSLPYIGYCFWSLNFDQACHWAFVAAAVGFGARTSEDRCARVVLAFCLGVAVSSLVMPFQLAGWQGIPQAGPGGGLFVNKNLAGEAALVGLLAAVEFFPLRSKEFATCMISTLPAIGLSTSRGVWLALLCATVFRLPWRWSLALCSAIALCGFILYFRGSSELSTDTLMQRMALWQDAARHLTWLGNGSYDYTTLVIREPNLHNDWLQFVYELGLVGLVPIGLVAVVRDRAPTFIVGFMVLGSVSFPLHLPATAWLAAVVVGRRLRGNVTVSRSVFCARQASA